MLYKYMSRGESQKAFSVARKSVVGLSLWLVGTAGLIEHSKGFT